MADDDPAVTYGSYLALDELLTLQRPRSAEHDELLFIVIHQVYELWFKQLLHEEPELRRRLATGNLAGGVKTLHRMRTIIKTIVAQIDVLETLTPLEFLSFRSSLARSSGFQSAQFREVEATFAPLLEALDAVLRARGHEETSLEERLKAAYRGDPDAAALCEAFVDVDEGLQEWRYRHVKMVERTIGSKPGTGGSAGAEYLRSTLFTPAFPTPVDHPRRAVRRSLGLAVAVAAALYALFALVTWRSYGNGGFDLGIFDQVVWHYSRFETPGSSVKGLANIWGDHFSPIMALLAPLYWLWDDARMLLLAQAVLVAVAAIPVFYVCEERVGRRPALALAITYLAFWGVASAIAFDVHEVAFAPLVIASLLLAIQRRRWRWYAALVFALLCVKEDQAILVVFVGVYVATLGERRKGALTALAGIAWYLLVTKVIVPPNNPAGFSYWSYDTFGSDPFSAVGGVLRNPPQLLTTLVDAPEKRHTLVLLIVPFLGLCLLSREAILLVPMFAERFLSSTQNYWGTSAHYTLSSVVVLVIGAAGGLRLVSDRVPVERRRLVLGGGAAAMLAINFLIATGFPLWDLTRGSFYEKRPIWSAADGALAAVPPHVSIAAQDVLQPRLAHRGVAAEISTQTGATDYLAAYMSGPLGNGDAINGGYGALTKFMDDRIAFAIPVAYEDGWLVLRSRALPPRPRTPALAPLDIVQAGRLRAALGPWQARHEQRVAAAARCARQGRGPCAGLAPSGDVERTLQITLDALGPQLSLGCKELATLAAFATARLDADLDAVRAAGAATPFDLATLQGAAGLAGNRIAENGEGYLNRFERLCAPAR